MIDDRVNRIYTLKNIVIRDDNNDYTATVTDFSVKGVSVKTEHILPTYKMIDLIITIDDKPVSVKGSVRWIHEHKKESKPRFNEIGIALHKPPKEYLEFIKKIAK